MTIIDATSAASLISAFTGVVATNIAGLLLIIGTMAAIGFVFRKITRHTKAK